MKFRTEIEIPASTFQFTIQDKMVFLGSCFSENIGAKFSRAGFNVVVNSHGILYNPMSILQALKDIIFKRSYSSEDIDGNIHLYFSFNHHGRFNSFDDLEILAKINQEIDNAHIALRSAKMLVLTFGSAHGYFLKGTGKMVANCHKLPADNFTKTMVTSPEIVSEWKAVLNDLFLFNPDLQVVFTVSPVRYWRDGALQNQLSKSHLIIACQTLQELFAQVSYFPAYEFVMDDLRDYRFFKEDMLHPNDLAIQYVWEKFIGWCLSKDTSKLLDKLEPHLRFLEHRPIHQNQEYNNLLIKHQTAIKTLIADSYKQKKTT